MSTKKTYAKVIGGLLLAGALSTSAFAADPTCEVQNNVDSQDTITVKSITKNSVVKVYDTVGTLIETAKASKDGDVVIKFKDQLTEDKLKVSVTASGATAGTPFEVAVPAETQTTAAVDTNVTVTNNVDIADVVKVTGLTDKATVKVKNSVGTLLGTGTVKSGAVEMKLSRNLAGDKVSVFVKEANKKESAATEVAIPAEGTTSAVAAENFSVANYTGKNKDVVTVKNLKEKTIVTVYNSDKSKVLGTAIAGKTGVATISFTADVLKKDDEIYVGYREYNKTGISLDNAVKLTVGTDVSADVASSDVTIDATRKIVKVANVKALDKIVLYKADGTTKIAEAKASKAGELTITLKTALTGDIKVTRTSDKMAESGKTTVSTTVVLATGSLGTADSTKITGLTAGKTYKISVGATSPVVKYVKADGSLSDTDTDAAALTGTEIPGLTNGETYKVEEVTP